MSTHCPVASFIRERITSSPRTLKEIAQQAGFESAEEISALADGLTSLPLSKVAPLAKALNADTGQLLRLCVTTYFPEVWKAIEPLQETALTRDELRLVRSWRSYVGASYVAALTDQSQKLLNAFLLSLRESPTVH